ncbi:hypothetical protein REPUB_Repub02eG0181400 [Reevesia pubescens]
MESTTVSSILSSGNETKSLIALGDAAVDAPTAAHMPTAPIDIYQNIPKPSKPRGKLGITTSEVWNHFTKFPCKDKAEQHASCNYCGNKIKCATISGTNGMRNHLSRYVRSSLARLQMLKICVEKEKIESKSLVCLDVETRWISTFLMLEATLKLERAFDRLEEQDPKYRDELESAQMKGCPTKINKEHARSMLTSLKVFYDSTLRISSSLYVTSNDYFRVVFGIGMRINDKFQDSNSSIKVIATRMKEKYHKYWGDIKNLNPFFFIFVILDPKYKMDYATFMIEEVYEYDKAE